MDLRQVGQDRSGRRERPAARVQPLFYLHDRQPLRQRPADLGFRRPLQILAHGPLGQSAGPGYLPLATAGGM